MLQDLEQTPLKPLLLQEDACKSSPVTGTDKTLEWTETGGMQGCRAGHMPRSSGGGVPLSLVWGASF